MPILPAMSEASEPARLPRSLAMSETRRRAASTRSSLAMRSTTPVLLATSHAVPRPISAIGIGLARTISRLRLSPSELLRLSLIMLNPFSTRCRVVRLVSLWSSASRVSASSARVRAASRSASAGEVGVARSSGFIAAAL